METFKSQQDEDHFSEKSKREELFEISAENIERLKSGFIKSAIEKGMFSSENEALKAIKEEKESVENNMDLTVNLSPESVTRFFEKGKQETLWDHLEETGSLENMKRAPTTQKKDLHSEYIFCRETAENALKQFVPEKNQDKKPIYAGLAGGTGQDLKRGACPAYGNLFLELDAAQLEKNVLNFNDSFGNVEKRKDDTYHFDKSSLLTVDDVGEAKAIVNLMRKHNNQFPTFGRMVETKDAEKMIKIDGKASGYIEVAIFDDITPENVRNIGVSLVNEVDLEGIGSLVDKYPQFKEKLKFFIRSKEVIGSLSLNWLEKNFSSKVDFVGEIDSADELWQEIGLKPEDSYSEIKIALNNKCDELWKEIRLYIPGSDFFSKACSANIRRVEQSMRSFKSRLDVTQKAGLYLKFEKERLFFN